LLPPLDRRIGARAKSHQQAVDRCAIKQAQRFGIVPPLDSFADGVICKRFRESSIAGASGDFERAAIPAGGYPRIQSKGFEARQTL
jgi:hypothetical protein